MTAAEAAAVTQSGLSAEPEAVRQVHAATATAAARPQARTVTTTFRDRDGQGGGGTWPRWFQWWAISRASRLRRAAACRRRAAATVAPATAA
uniref:hypothetical protein n=1 Tax=Streptomyces sp. HYC2 TaxID=2955207 RepID=UPI0024813F83